jgi:hypothetical protein
VRGSHRHDAEAPPTIRPDLDDIDALAPERDALWSRLNAATFLTTQEKRSAAGYDNARADSLPAQKFTPHHDDRGRFTFAPDGDDDDGDPSFQLVARRPSPPPTPPKPAQPAQPPPATKPSTKPSEPPKKLEDVLKPGGQDRGTRNPGATDEIRTVNPVEFAEIQDALLSGAREIPAPPGYTGKWFARSDGTVIGIRNSAQSGPTLEVVQGGSSGLKNGYKVHRR